MTREINLSWQGMLTIDNIDEVAKLIFQLLGGKEFVLMEKNGLFKFKPQFTANQRLCGVSEKGIEVRREGNNSAGFNPEYTDAVLPISTDLKDEIFDPRYRNPHIRFEKDKVTIVKLTDAGHLMGWTAIVGNEDKIKRFERREELEDFAC